MAERGSPHPLLESTAYWTAAARGKESEREDGLFNDPWAKALAGQVGADWLARRAGDVFSTVPMAIRTRFFDEFMERSALEQGIRQFVILAAGLDTRAYRLKWPEGTRLFELDQPSVLQYKEQILRGAGAQAACDRTAIEGDLTQPWSEGLLRGGFDAQRPAGWLLEGFLYYLSNEGITRMLDQVSQLAAPGSRMGFDIINGATLTSPITRPWIDMQVAMGAPWIGSVDDPEGFLAERGWKSILTQPGAEDANYGRWKLPVIPVRMPGMPHNWYVTAEKQ